MRRSRRILAVLVVALPLTIVAPGAAQVVIDEFSTVQGPVSSPPGGGSTAVTGGSDILGQTRGLRAQLFAGPGPVTAQVSGGAATIGVADTTPDSTGAVFMIWDGDSDPNAIDPTGLGAVDLTAGGAGGFRFSISAAVAGTSLVLEVYEDADSVSRGALVLPAIAAPVDIFVDFSSLARAPGAATPADLTAVGALALRVESGEAVPAVAIDRIETAAPQLSALKVDRTPAGDPIPGAVAPGDTIRYRITIANTGAGAAGVELADVLDPNLALVAGSVRTTPLARPDVYRTLTDQPLDSSAAALPSLLDNDADPDGNALAAAPATGQATSQGGSVDIAADGHFVYAPPAGFNGVDDFAYTIAVTAGDPTVDASGAPIGAATARARIVIDRAPPVVVAGGTLAYTENDPPTAVDAALTVTDADSANLVSATVQITGNYQNGEDLLSFADTATITGVFTPATGTLALNGLDTVAAWQTALRSVAYENSSEDPDESDRTVTWIASDGVETSAAATSTIEVTSVNDAPVVTTSGGATSFVEDAGAVVVDGALTVTDADDTDLVSATVTLTNPQNGAQEALSVGAPAATCPGLVVSAPGHALSISGTATVAVYQGCLRSVLYDHSSQNPTALPDRLITFVANDGDDPSNTAQKTVTVTPVNDPPVAGDDLWQSVGNTQLVVDLAALTTPHVRDLTAGAADGVRDNDADPVEGDNHVVSGIVGCADLTPPFSCPTANGGTVVLDAVGTFAYTPAAGDAAASDSFQYVLTDDGAPPASDTATVTIQRFERVWYVDNDFGAGGNGTSASPFNSLAPLNGAGGAGDVDGVNDYVFVHFGDGGTTGQSAGFVLENGQRLLGEHVGLSIPADLNGNGSPAVLFAAVSGNRPMLDDTVAGGPEGVSAFDVIPAEVAGLNLGGNVNALEWTTTAAFAGSGTAIVRDNIVRSAAATGVDVNLAGTGALRLAFHDNNLTAAGAGLAIAETGSGSLTITAFDDNVVHGNTGGAGLSVTSATFDSTPGLPINTVAGGTTAIGQSGNGVGGAGLVLTNVFGDIAFTDLDVFADGGAGLTATSTGALNAGAGTGFRITVPAAVATIDANGGPAVSVNNASVTLPLAFLESTSSTTTGLSLVNAFGGAGLTALSASSGQITDPGGASGAAVQITGGSGHVTLGIPITNTSGNAVSISGRTADTVSFTGAIAETGSGVSLTGNSGTALVSFRGGLTASTGANPAFTATGGGNVEVCDENPCNPSATGSLVNTLATTTGTALNVVSTTIGANRLEFRSIASNGAGSGIILNTTGSLGGLVVSGTGSTDGTGGTIQNISGRGASFINAANIILRNMNFTNTATVGGTPCGSAATAGANDGCNAAIHLNNVATVSLDNLNITTSGQQGINGINVTGFSLTNSALSGLGNAPDEDGLHFHNMLGISTISATTIASSGDDNVNIQNRSATASTISFTGGSFNTGVLGSGLLFGIRDTANTTINISGVTVDNNFSGGIVADGFDTATLRLDVTGTTITNNNDGIALSANNGLTQFDIDNNDFIGQDFANISLLKAAFSTAGTLEGAIRNNDPINTANGRPADAIVMFQAGGGALRTSIANNTFNYGGTQRVILVQAGQDGNGSVDATITGNTVDVQLDGAGNAVAGILAQSAITGPGVTTALCADIGGAGALANTFTHSLGGNMLGGELRLRQRNDGTVRLPGYAGGATDTAAVVTYLAGRNTLVNVPAATATADSTGFAGGTACTAPAFP